VDARQEKDRKKPAERELCGQKQLQGGVYIQQRQVKGKVKNDICVFSNESYLFAFNSTYLALAPLL
ncbi:MAG: hypothetical protein ACXU7H_08360, partial [Burkholderiaceae bacterium]